MNTHTTAALLLRRTSTYLVPVRIKTLASSAGFDCRWLFFTDAPPVAFGTPAGAPARAPPDPRDGVCNVSPSATIIPGSCQHIYLQPRPRPPSMASASWGGAVTLDDASFTTINTAVIHRNNRPLLRHLWVVALLDNGSPQSPVIREVCNRTMPIGATIAMNEQSFDPPVLRRVWPVCPPIYYYYHYYYYCFMHPNIARTTVV